MVGLDRQCRLALAMVIVQLAGCASSAGTPSPPPVVAAPSAPVVQPSPTSTQRSTRSPSTATPAPTPTATPAPTPNPLGFELRDRIVAFARAARQATTKLRRTTLSEISVRAFAAASDNMTALAKVKRAEWKWADGPDSPIRNGTFRDCPLFEVWWDTAIAGGISESITAEGLDWPGMNTDDLYGKAIARVSANYEPGHQAKLDKAIARLKDLNKRVAALAAAVEAAPDPCAIDQLP